MKDLQTTHDDMFSVDTMKDIAGQLSERSIRVYQNDAKAFASWMIANSLVPAQLTYSNMVAYRSYLLNEKKYANATAHRMFSVARRILTECVHSGILASNPAKGAKGIQVEDETTHTALTKRQAEDLIKSIDRSTVKGKRDYAIIMLLIRTGIRRTECVKISMGDMQQQQGHNVLFVAGKGGKRGVVKLPVDVYRAIQSYIDESHRQDCTPDDPLFIRFDRGDHPSEKRLTDKAIEWLVKAYGASIGVPELTPHGLRATFVTLCLEEGAALHQVQYAARHKDPRTTERYQTRKLNLDNNAVDFIKLSL